MDLELTRTLDAIQQTLAALAARVAALEAAVSGTASDSSPPVPGPAPAEPQQAAPELTAEAAAPSGVAMRESGAMRAPQEEVAPEVLLVIAAAVAAYLGERAHVRQVRLISSQAWGQQGRVNVQASHALHR